MEDKKLYGSLSYATDAEFETFVQELDPAKAVAILVAASAYAQGKGIYNEMESALLVRSIRQLVPQSEQGVQIVEQPKKEGNIEDGPNH